MTRLNEITESYDDILAEDLQDDEYLLEYLNNALDDSDPRHFLLALRRATKARGLKMSDLAKKLNVNRRGLYVSLSAKGNPSWTTLHAILDFLGLNMKVFRKTAI